MAWIVVSACLAIGSLFVAGVIAHSKDFATAAVTCAIGIFLMVEFSVAIYNYAEPAVPTDPPLRDQTFLLMGKVPVHNACGKYGIFARREDGSLADFCTSQNVPDGIFKVTGDPKNLYVPYAPFADSNQAPPPSPAPSH